MASKVLMDANVMLDFTLKKIITLKPDKLFKLIADQELSACITPPILHIVGYWLTRGLQGDLEWAKTLFPIGFEIENNSKEITLACELFIDISYLRVSDCQLTSHWLKTNGFYAPLYKLGSRMTLYGNA